MTEGDGGRPLEVEEAHNANVSGEKMMDPVDAGICTETEGRHLFNMYVHGFIGHSLQLLIHQIATSTTATIFSLSGTHPTIPGTGALVVQQLTDISVSGLGLPLQ